MAGSSGARSRLAVGCGRLAALLLALLAVALLLLAAACARIGLPARLARLPAAHYSTAAQPRPPGAVQLGLLGTSGIARFAAVWPARKSAVCEVAAVGGRSVERARVFADAHGVGRWHGSYEALLADPRVEAVYISVPTVHHHRWGMAALRAGKHVLLEKPMALNLREAEELVAEAAARGLLLQEAYHYRHHPLALRLRALATGSGLGRLRRLELEFDLLDPKALGLGAQPAEHAGRLAKGLDRWCYLADLVAFLLLEPGGDGAATAAVVNASISADGHRFAAALRVGGVAVTLAASKDRVVPPAARQHGLGGGAEHRLAVPLAQASPGR